MIRSGFAKPRKPMKRGTKPMARAGRLRPISKTRDPEAEAFYRAEVASIVARVGSLCEGRAMEHRCWGPIDTHHVQKRSRFGKNRWREAHDRSNLLRLCRSAHDWTDEPALSKRGHLNIEALGGEQYELVIFRGYCRGGMMTRYTRAQAPA